MTIVVTGASGKLGTAIRDAAAERDIETIACSRSLDGSIEPAELERHLEERTPAAVIDVSVPERTHEVIDACVATKTPLVIGTTGFAVEASERFDRASEQIPLLKASNFARGVHALETLVREAVGLLESYDIELTETHHNRKRDAPSGTAKSLLETIEAERELDDRVFGREGHQPRSDGNIGVHVRRAGSIHGEHEILLAGNDEALTITHRAESRRVFAAGALDSARWLADRPAGRYAFSEVVAEQ
ncbi:4-hydroxy-tetrahydrodipicolinate reductase [Halocatena halophila]|uniref:4-hydroxy-tetrahydrodipicolinate reductase n=1 Tax=Halocatena halophila TaxID=2814576 RepID=UPI002ED56F4E